MLKVLFLAAFVAVTGGFISMTTSPATSQSRIESRDTIVPLAMPIPANLPIESYQTV